MNCYQYRWQKGISRYYKVYLAKDLLDTWVLTCVWGGINSRLGNYKKIAYASLEEAFEFIELLMKKRIKRGYKLISIN